MPLVRYVGGTWRVGGILALSRAFGDAYLKGSGQFEGVPSGSDGYSSGFGVVADPTVALTPLTRKLPDDPPLPPPVTPPGAASQTPPSVFNTPPPPACHSFLPLPHIWPLQATSSPPKNEQDGLKRSCSSSPYESYHSSL